LREVFLMRCPVSAAAFYVLAALCAPGADFTIGGGAGPASGNSRADPSGKDVSPSFGGTLLVSGGLDFLHLGKAAVGVEVPFSYYGSRRSDTYASGGYASVYTERITAALTPGIRVRAASAARWSPWVSFGAGIASIHRTGQDYQLSQPAAAQEGSSRVLALAPAAGVDVRLARRWFLRAELRNYLYQTPATGFVSSFTYWNRWNWNPVAAVSIGLR
jgi:hypothetical protein